MSSSSSIGSNLSSDSHEEETTEFSSNGGTIEIVTPNNNKSVASMTPLVFVVLDCVYYTAGERVTGEILLNVPADTPPGILMLKSQGEEETIVYTGPRNHENKHEAKNKVFDFESKLYEWETHVKEGQYVFPFTFKLPCFAPSTFYFSGEDSSGNYLKGSIAYTISAEFQVTSDSSKSLRHSRQLLIRSCQTRGKVNVCVESAEPVPGCCVSKGVTNLKLSVKGEDHSTVEGSVKYKLEPDNSRCNAAINQVTGIITLQIDMIMRDRTFTYSRVLSNMSRAAWISARSNLVFEKDFEYCADLKVPGDFQNPSTVDSPLIKSKYVIEVILFYDISCGNKPISISLPIYVLPRNLISRETPSLPRNWEPQEHTIVNLVVDDRTSSGNYSDRMAEIV